MKCPECGLENPPSAVLCDCGYNFETKVRTRFDSKPESKHSKVVYIILAVLGLLILLGILGQNSSKAPDTDQAYVMSQKFVKGRLKTPSTAEFPSLGDKSISSISLGQSRFKVEAWVDAQNSFGAKIRSKYTCTLEYLGNDQWQAASVKIGN